MRPGSGRVINEAGEIINIADAYRQIGNVTALRVNSPSDPVILVKQLRLSGNGAQNLNCFDLNGTVIIDSLFLKVRSVVDSTTLQGAYFDADDGAVQVPITAAPGTDLSGITDGSLVSRIGGPANALDYNKADQIRGDSLSSAPMLINSKLLAPGQTDKIRFNFTGDANTDVQVEVYMKCYIVGQSVVTPSA